MAGTLDDRLVATSGRPSGFDYLRIFLAVGVVVQHTGGMLNGVEAEADTWRHAIYGPMMSLIVPCFFALSGFLVAGSLERNDLPSFLTLRGLRIFPALVVEVVLSALLIGTLMTTLPLAEYFSSPTFHAYFLNTLGIIHYQLPGVFTTNPRPDVVNGQLWTVPFELECYAAIAILALLGCRKWPRLMLAGLFLVTVAFTANQHRTGNFPPEVWPLGGRHAVMCFLFGVALYINRTRIPFNIWLAVVAFVLAWFMMDDRRFSWLSPLPVAYLTIYVGLLDPRRIALIKSADYSYGIYLYGFAVQQTVVAVLPENLRVWWVHLPLSLALAGLCAWLSWTFVEAPVMTRKKLVLGWVARIPWPGARKAKIAAEAKV